MDPEIPDPRWIRLAKALFGARKTTDEGLFVYRVMEQIRALPQTVPDLAWPRFLRWAVPLLGASAATLVLAARSPLRPTLSLETTVLQQQTPEDDPLSSVLEVTP